MSSGSVIEVEGLTFTFPEGWRIWKYDDWSFYRNQFQSAFGGAAAVDLIDLDPRGHLWLIEAKNYRRHQRTNPEELSDEVARKVRDTLAAILPASLHANDEQERGAAKALLFAKKLHVVLHLEQPVQQSRLHPQVADPAKLQFQLRQKGCLRGVDVRARVTGSARASTVPWTVL